MENRKTNEPHIFVLKLLQILDFCFSKLVCLLHLESIRQCYKNNKLKTIAPTRNDEFELPGGSYSVSNIIIPIISIILAKLYQVHHKNMKH